MFVVGTHYKCLIGEALLMNTHNICFYGEIRKDIPQMDIMRLGVPETELNARGTLNIVQPRVYSRSRSVTVDVSQQGPSRQMCV